MGLIKFWKLARILAIAAAGLWLGGCASMEYYQGAGHFNTVVLDPGHGGNDLGGRSVAKHPEKVHALDIALRTAQILRSRGYNVILTRTTDVFIPLPQRVAISNRTHDSVFVSIHLNWTRRHAAEGIETYYFAPRSRRLAANILKEVTHVYNARNRGVKWARFHVLRNNKRPAVLTELGFLSNPQDARLMEKASHRQRLAEAIARGIIAEDAGRIP